MIDSQPPLSRDAWKTEIIGLPALAAVPPIVATTAPWNQDAAATVAHRASIPRHWYRSGFPGPLAWARCHEEDPVDRALPEMDVSRTGQVAAADGEACGAHVGALRARSRFQSAGWRSASSPLAVVPT